MKFPISSENLAQKLSRNANTNKTLIREVGYSIPLLSISLTFIPRIGYVPFCVFSIMSILSSKEGNSISVAFIFLIFSNLKKRSRTWRYFRSTNKYLSNVKRFPRNIFPTLEICVQVGGLWNCPQYAKWFLDIFMTVFIWKNDAFKNASIASCVSVPSLS